MSLMTKPQSAAFAIHYSELGVNSDILYGCAFRGNQRVSEKIRLICSPCVFHFDFTVKQTKKGTSDRTKCGYVVTKSVKLLKLK